MNRFSRKIRFGVCAVVLFGLGGCSYLPKYNADGGDSRAQGDELSPEQKHALAKAQVEPNKMVQHNAYVKDEKEAKVVVDEQKRVLEMERDLDIVKNEFKGLKDVVKPEPKPVAVKTVVATQAPSATPMPAPALSAAVSSSHVMKPAPNGGSAEAVKGVRIGVYPAKTRLVIDLNGQSAFEFDLDNDHGLLVMKLPVARWDAPMEKIFKNSNVIKAYAAKMTGDGQALVAFKLHAPAKVITSQHLGKNAAGFHRIFLDVAPL